MKNIFSNSIVRIVFIFCLVSVISYVYYVIRTIPSDFPTGKHFIVHEGESLRSVSIRLEEEHFIYSALFFRVWISSLGGDRGVQLGEYTFNEKHVLGFMVKRFISTGPDIPLISVTIPEGSTVSDIALLMAKVLPDFSIDIFSKEVFLKKVNGRLFPSTYFLLPSNTESDIITMLTKTFDKKYNLEFKNIEIEEPLKTQNDVIILASIIEGEAKDKQDMQMVSGILQKRMKLGIALQVDVAKETYKTRGLPKEPINNPGINALYAALSPIEGPYLYYITGKDGTMHYAKTFDEHKINIQKYLR